VLNISIDSDMAISLNKPKAT